MPATSPKKLKNLLFIDVKTVAGVASFEQLDARMQQHWESKISRYKNEEPWTTAEWYANRASYYAEFGKIICVGVGGVYWDDDDQPHLKIKTLANDQEEAILSEFSQIIARYPPKDLVLCAHNGKEFDYPYLCRRMVAHGIELPLPLQLTGKKPWEIPHLDMLEQWQFVDKRHYVALDLLAASLNVPTEPLPWSGDKTSFVYHQESDLERIRHYTEQSIEMLVQVYLHLTNTPLITAGHVVVSD
ncbi:MAG: ribonuclease H-like domain-containing protein [Bacteroidetes bacterium]|nr:ribonuclease H-like domain-containing protein [Fibrella sp.]